MELEAVAVVGPTASGKTRRAVEIAKLLEGEIISADSRQIYRGMTIGTGKDLCEYGDVPYHLIDIAEPGTKYNLHRYLSDFRKSYSDITTKGKMPIICGGTGMYIENALNGIILPEVPENPELRESLKDKTLSELEEILKTYKTLHNTTDIDTAKRAIRAIEIEEYYLQHPDLASNSKRENATPINALVIGIDIPREDRRNRISDRLDARLEEGMIEEIKSLIDSRINPEDLIYYGLEYKFVTLHVIGKLSFDEMRHNLEIAIHQFAKRQMTWFRGMEKRGTHIEWVPWNLSDEEFEEAVLNLLRK
ncbi:MAG: tRNA (adenosine(37)-N6)-dimethylallyltransferase MiaA [Muribaculaceae bacterium]|nr:tRNA (adenosine(37)-N6)-dimethylallyltransferase MiaA [Muribaculaceae bacterium]